jgi:hypothetical protein
MAEEKLPKILGISGLGFKSLPTRLEAEIPAIQGRVSTEKEKEGTSIMKDGLQEFDEWDVKASEHETSN